MKAIFHFFFGSSVRIFILLFPLLILIAGVSGAWIYYESVNQIWLKNRTKHIEKLKYYYLTIQRKIHPEIFNKPLIKSNKEDFKKGSVSFTTIIYDIKGKEIGKFSREDRSIVGLPYISPHFINALIATEDREFNLHHGVNYKAIFRALIRNISAMKIIQGGSTITQQLAKVLFFPRQQRTIKRKIYELLIAQEIENLYDKNDILLMYVNYIYFGHNIDGIEEAAKFYFNKNAKNLTLSESALLAGVISNPSQYSPLKNYKKAKARHFRVLKGISDAHYIPKESYKKLHKQFWAEYHFIKKIKSNKFKEILKNISDHENKKHLLSYYFKDRSNYYIQKKGLSDKEKSYIINILKSAGYFGNKNTIIQSKSSYVVEEVRRQMVDKLKIKFDNDIKKANEFLYTKGWRIYTTIDIDIQKTAERMLRRGIYKYRKQVLKNRSLKRKLLFLPKQIKINKLNSIITKLSKKSIKHLLASYTKNTQQNSYILNDHLTAKEKRKIIHILDSVGYYIQFIQGALVSIDPRNGHIKAFVGGYQFNQNNQFNRAFQAKRQTGSAFKPICYLAALEKQFVSPYSLRLDSYKPIELEDHKIWKVKNYANRYTNKNISLTQALKISSNQIAAQLISEMGVGKIREIVKYSLSLDEEKAMLRFPDGQYSIALGTVSMTPLELAQVYAMMANRGRRVTPKLILQVKDLSGDTIILDDESDSDILDNIKVVSKESAYQITEMMRQVLTPGGTGWRMKNKLKLKFDVAGKTGTSQNYRDLWFAGYTPELCAVVWIGHDRNLPLNGGGGKVAAPIFGTFMKAISKKMRFSRFKLDKSYNFRYEKICRDSGKIAVEGKCTNINNHATFNIGTEPGQYCGLKHNQKRTLQILLSSAEPKADSFNLDKTESSNEKNKKKLKQSTTEKLDDLQDHKLIKLKESSEIKINSISIESAVFGEESKQDKKKSITTYKKKSLIKIKKKNRPSRSKQIKKNKSKSSKR